MTIDEVRIGVIGCGEHSRENLIPSLLQIPGARITAICDNDEHNLKAASMMVPSAAAVDDADAVHNRNDIDAIVLAGPPQLHTRVAKLAISDGKHVFIEKPPAVSTPELLQLTDLAESSSVVTCVGHNLRHAAAVVAMQDAMGRFGGCPVSFSIYYVTSGPLGTRWGLSSSVRSLLLSHGTHVIDLSMALMGEPVSLVARAVAAETGGITISLLMTYPNKALCSVVISTGGCQFYLEARSIFGNGAMVHLDGLKRVAVYTPDGRGRRWSEIWEPRTLVSGYGWSGYLHELEGFVRAIQNSDHTSPSLADELLTYRVVDQIEAQLLSAGTVRATD